jgi:XTP/dITP diphosphohydrolase
MEKKLEAFARLLKIMDELRENLDEIKEELGDLMLHLVFYAKIAEEKKAFDIADAMNAVCDKLIHRHPHIYGDVKVNGEEDVMKNWERLKLAEGKKSVLQGVPKSLPAMVKAYRMQEKTAQVGFEWENAGQVWEKVEEEMAEMKETLDLDLSQERKEEEFGDVIFSLINYARFKGIDPETALERINLKFKTRFEYIEANADRDLEEMSLEEMDKLWNEAKNRSLR